MNFGKLSTTYLKISELTAEQKNLLADVICECKLEIFKDSLDGLRNPSDTPHYRYIYYKMGGVYCNDHFTRFRYLALLTLITKRFPLKNIFLT